MRKAYETSGGHMFQETERFPKWLTIVILSPLVLTAGIMLFLGTSEEMDKNEMRLALGILVPLEIILFFLFRAARLEKIVTTNGLYFRWAPLQKKFRVIEKEEIKETGIRKTPAMKLGSNWVPGYGRVHAASRGDGEEVILTNGKKIFFSSADALSLDKALQELVRSNRKIQWSES